MTQANLHAIEREYRQQWQHYAPQKCREYLSRADNQQQADELLVRLLCIDLELTHNRSQTSTEPPHEDDEQRLHPCVYLFLLHFPELRQNHSGLQRLILLEYALKLQRSEQPPSLDSYVALCPSPNLLRNLEEAQARLLEMKCCGLEEPESKGPVQLSSTTVPQADIQDSFLAPTVPFSLGRYLLTRYLGRGGMGFVFAAIDLSSTAQVAIKMMRRGDGWSVFRFIEEFQWLSQLSHPNVVRLYDAFAEGEMRYFSMEFIEGCDIRSWYEEVRHNQAEHFVVLQRSLVQLASAIDFLHAQGVIHRDIKCSNVMITSSNRTVLLDLGLAIRPADQGEYDNPLVGDAMPGTFLYMSPEAYNNQRLTAASDWYSFGITLFELLTGNAPKIRVHQQDEQGCIRKIFIYEPELLREQLTAAPVRLAELCVQLLHPDPVLRPDGTTVLEVLGAAPSTGLPQGEYFGRGEQLDELKAIAEKCSASSDFRQLITLSGDAGMGKSLLLETWLASESCKPFCILPIRCYRQDHTPYRLWNQIVQQLIRRCAAFSQPLQKRLRDQAGLIGQCFPQLLQLVQEDTAALTSSSETCNSIKSCISALLETLVHLSRSHPLLLAIEDAHWSDTTGLEDLVSLLRDLGFHGLIVLTTDHLKRIESTLDLVGEFHDMHHVVLQPLTQRAAQDLLESWCAATSLSLSPSELRRVTLLSKGCPFLLREIFRSLQVQQFVASDFNAQQFNIQQLVFRRFAKIPRKAEKTLQYLAVADQPLFFQQLAAMGRMSPHDLQASLNILSHQGWIRVQSHESETTAEIASESYRAAILESMPLDRLHRRHHRLAKVLSAEISPPWSRIGHHYEQSENHRLAATCYVEAARAAFAQGAWPDAIGFIDKSNRPHAKRTCAEQLKLLELKADCLLQLGRQEEADLLLTQMKNSESLVGQGKLLLHYDAAQQFPKRNQRRANWLRDSLDAIGHWWKHDSKS